MPFKQSKDIAVVKVLTLFNDMMRFTLFEMMLITCYSMIVRSFYTKPLRQDDSIFSRRRGGYTTNVGSDTSMSNSLKHRASRKHSRYIRVRWTHD